MARQKIHPLEAGYSAEVDEVDEPEWSRLMQEFDDCNLNQTWAFGAVMSGRHKISHLIVRLHDEVVAIAQVRLKKVPLIGYGVAYVSWGPMWRRRGRQADTGNFRQAVRALRNEFVCRRGLTLRLFPLAFEGNEFALSAILADEGLLSVKREEGDRTLLLDMTPPLEKLREGMEHNWRRCLRHGEQSNLEIVEGTETKLLDDFATIYKEMTARKMFTGAIDLERLKKVQAQLPQEQKLKILLCRSGEEACAGLVASTMGKMGVDLLAATSDTGMHSYGSYVLRWKVLEELKEKGASVHNLNGINPVSNPGTYRFKRGMAGKNGRDLYYLGKFDADPDLFSHALMRVVDGMRREIREMKPRLTRMRAGIAQAYGHLGLPARHGGAA